MLQVIVRQRLRGNPQSRPHGLLLSATLQWMKRLKFGWGPGALTPEHFQLVFVGEFSALKELQFGLDLRISEYRASILPFSEPSARRTDLHDSQLLCSRRLFQFLHI